MQLEDSVHAEGDIGDFADALQRYSGKAVGKWNAVHDPLFLPTSPRSPREAIARGIAYLTEDRRALGLFLLPVRDNLVVASQRAVVSRLRFLLPQRVRQTAMALLQRLDVRPLEDGWEVSRLSGGNQQKVLLGRWLAAAPRVLIADEPTRGVDVGAKRRIHGQLQELARQGLRIILISSDLPEVLAMSGRVLVIARGPTDGHLR